jgi:hypothetical protein
MSTLLTTLACAVFAPLGTAVVSSTRSAVSRALQGLATVIQYVADILAEQKKKKSLMLSSA